jgi:hypothetical protein
MMLVTNEVWGTILDDDPAPTLFIDNPACRERDLETTNLVFRLALSCASAFTTSVSFATVDGTAIGPVDFTPTNGTVTFLPGVTNALVSVTIRPDLVAEDDESVFLILSNPQALLLLTNRATGTILDDDNISIRITSAQALEGVTNRFTVTLSKPPSSELTVAFATVDNTAMSPADYVGTNGTLRFPAFATNQTIGVVHLSDAVDEPDEFYFVNLGNPSRGMLELSQGVGTIKDGDPPCISVNDAVVIDSGLPRLTGTFTVSLSSTSAIPVSFAYFTRDGTALDPTDYTGRSGVTNIPPGVASVQISIDIKGNTLDETNEYFYIVLTNATNATFCDRVGICTIATGTNVPPSVSLPFPPPGNCFTLPTNLLLRASALDSDGIIVRVRFFAGTNLIQEVTTPPYEVTWSPTKAGDFALTAVAQDNFVDFSTSAPVFVSLRWPATNLVSDVSVIEGSSMTNLDFVLSLEGPSCQTVSVQAFTADGTARAGSDYFSLSPTNVTFLPGETLAVVRVKVIGDTAIEPDKTVFLILTNPVNIALSRNYAIGTIINDDTNEGPSVVIVTPLNGELFYAPPGLIPILANAWDPDGYITEVQFFAGSTLIGRSTNGPFDTRWTNNVVGYYILTAIATDNAGAKATSAPVSIIVSNCPANVTVAPLADQTVCACGAATLSVSLSNPGSVPIGFVWRFNSQIIPGQTGSSLTLYSLSSAHAGIYSVEVRTPCQSFTKQARLTITGEGLPNPLVLTYSNSIPVNDGSAVQPGTSIPYPVPIDVQCVPGVVQKVTATLSRLRHNFPGDFDILLVSPSRKALKLMSDVTENPIPVHDITLTFDDNATQTLPAFTPFDSGIYKPTDFQSNDGDAFSGLPAGVTYVTNLAGFTNTNPNGIWGLYAIDDAQVDTGAIEGGWSLNIWWEDLPPRLAGPVMLANGSVRLTLFSQSGRTHFIEASSDLQHWIPISTNVMVGMTMPIVLSNQLVHTYRFYRVQRCPSIDILAADRPPRLTNPEYLGNGLFRADLVSIPGRTLAVEASTDLRQWTRVSTNTMAGDVMPVTISGLGTLQQRFFRALVLP